MNGQIQVPTNTIMGASIATVNMNFGLTAGISKYQRVCMVYINSPVNQAVPRWTVLGNLPKPIWPVIVTNPAYNDHYLNLTNDGQLRANVDLPNNWYIQVAFSYIMANDESTDVELIVPQDHSLSTYSDTINGLNYHFTRKGDLCTLMINGQVTNAIAQWDHMRTIPEAYVPASDVYMRFTNDGLIGVYHNTIVQAAVTMSAGMWVTGSVAYIANS